MSSLISFHCHIFTSFLSSQPGPHFLLCLLYHYPSQSLSSFSFPFCNSYFLPCLLSFPCLLSYPTIAFSSFFSFLLPVLPLVFLSLSSPFCLFLISHSQVLPDSFIPLFFSHCLLSISTSSNISSSISCLPPHFHITLLFLIFLLLPLYFLYLTFLPSLSFSRSSFHHPGLLFPAFPTFLHTFLPLTVFLSFFLLFHFLFFSPFISF